MKKKSLFILFALGVLLAKANQTDSESNFKSPYSWGVIPALAYDADLGLKYGAVFNLFDYDIYDIHPQYHQYLYAKIINSTGGTLQLQALLESDKLIKGAKSSPRQVTSATANSIFMVLTEAMPCIIQNYPMHPILHLSATTSIPNKEP